MDGSHNSGGGWMAGHTSSKKHKIDTQKKGGVGATNSKSPSLEESGDGCRRRLIDEGGGEEGCCGMYGSHAWFTSQQGLSIHILAYS